MKVFIFFILVAMIAILYSFIEYSKLDPVEPGMQQEYEQFIKK